jgi:pimeloyl-ACP methyl ester carboxylesterase
MSDDQRNHRRSSRAGSFLRAYSVETIAAVLVALGLFLLLERMNIRSTLFRWASIGTRSAFHALGHLDDAIAYSIARLTLSDALGLALVVVAVLAIVLRIRSRLVRTAAETVLRCPRCGGSIHRVHRRWGDRVVSWFVPVRRYRCSNRECRWCGIRVAASKHGVEPAAPAR